MKARLMYSDRDFDPQAPLPSSAAALVQDLELDTIFDAMASGDAFLRDVARRAALASLGDVEVIRYRQNILTDALQHPDVIRELYGIAIEALEREKRIWGSLHTRYPEMTLHRAIELLELFTGLFGQLRRFAENHRATFHSQGLKSLCEMLARELDEQYVASVEDHLRRLAFRSGILLSAELGPANKGTHYVLRTPPRAPHGWRERLQIWVERASSTDRSSYVYEVAERDEAGFAALGELRGRGIVVIAEALGQSADHVLSFFKALRLELAFYVGALNLRDRLAERGRRFCRPEAQPVDTTLLSAREIYDVALSLRTSQTVVGNDIHADGMRLVMMTGPNRGGKSTLLRALGQAQLMLQSGLFVAADEFRSTVCDRLFTHFKREEDPTMKHGKLDEELARMSAIVDELSPRSMVLLNESFASTNEREGSEIARQLLDALLVAGVKVLYVTHLFELARALYEARLAAALFLRAEREADGRRTFRLIEGEPLPTSHAQDLYRRIFSEDSSGSERHARATGG
jgi:hypothetical protein